MVKKNNIQDLAIDNIFFNLFLRINLVNTLYDFVKNNNSTYIEKSYRSWFYYFQLEEIFNTKLYSIIYKYRQELLNKNLIIEDYDKHILVNMLDDYIIIIRRFFGSMEKLINLTLTGDSEYCQIAAQHELMISLRNKLYFFYAGYEYYIYFKIDEKEEIVLKRDSFDIFILEIKNDTILCHIDWNKFCYIYEIMTSGVTLKNHNDANATAISLKEFLFCDVYKINDDYITFKLESITLFFDNLLEINRIAYGSHNK